MTRKHGVSSMRIAARLKDERARLGYTHAEMGAAAGVSRNAAAAWEKGTSIPSTSLALLAEQAFDVQYVLTGIYSRNAEDAAKNARDDVRPIMSLDEWEVLHAYRGLDSTQRAQAKAMIQVLGGQAGRAVQKSITEAKSPPETGHGVVVHGIHSTGSSARIAAGDYHENAAPPRRKK